MVQCSVGVCQHYRKLPDAPVDNGLDCIVHKLAGVLIDLWNGETLADSIYIGAVLELLLLRASLLLSLLFGRIFNFTHCKKMNLCNECQKVQGTITCPCGKFIYCSPNCVSNSKHISDECNYRTMNHTLLISIMHTFVPILDAVSKDEELHNSAKNFLKLLIEKLHKTEIK